jgi:hypothetical protein
MRAFLRRLFHDHRDDLISQLVDERDYLRNQLDSARKESLALTNLSAFRQVHKEVEGLPPNVPIPDVLGGLRDTTFMPEYTLEDKRKAFEEE